MRFTVFIALSLALHALWVLCAYLWEPDFMLTRSTRPQPVEVTYVKKSKAPEGPEKQFIKKLNIPDNLKFENPDEVHFFSEERQRVIQEIRARETGLSKNREQGPRFLQEDEKLAQKKSKEKAADGYEIFNPKNEIQKFAIGESTLSVKLPDNIAVGSLTALNTDRSTYYTFYSRLEDMIYLRWADLIGKAVESYPVDFKRKKLVGRSWKTNVVILLKPNGEFHRAEIYDASGVDKFDISPVLAFQDARIFPNPPPEMVRSDGYIHISYSFVVDFGRVQ